MLCLSALLSVLLTLLLFKNINKIIRSSVATFSFENRFQEKNEGMLAVGIVMVMVTMLSALRICFSLSDV